MHHQVGPKKSVNRNFRFLILEGEAVGEGGGTNFACDNGNDSGT
jgi:hypothetical protein